MLISLDVRSHVVEHRSLSFMLVQYADQNT
jgi:hypothetical protein